jgi:mevalonate kinase
MDGATAFAIPTKFGQSLEIIPSEKQGIRWKSYDQNKTIWFEDTFTYAEISSPLPITTKQNSKRETLLKILQKAKRMNSSFLEGAKGWKVTAKLNFPRDWGLGTSSTLINNIAQWAGVESFVLLSASFGGSGYDVAAAKNNTPILYKKHDGHPLIEKVEIHWSFTDRLFFVHLNKKQDSKEGIRHYRKTKPTITQLTAVSAISHSLLVAETLSEFEILLQKHEEIISKIIQLPTIKKRLFNDYEKTVKSLGAWGGDFILATGDEKDMEYFRKKGYHTIIAFPDMLL